MRYKLVVSYDGGCFNGWQKQPSGRPTVQGTLEKIIEQILRSPTRVIGAGRTDTGVHAVAQVAHFDSDRDLGSSFQRSLNALAPDGLVIKSVWQVPDDFHALASAIHKTYVYRIWNASHPSVFWRQWAYGSPMAPKLNIFREFRRKFLIIDPMGRKFIHAYNKYGPIAAGWISEREWARTAARGILWPFYGFAYLSLKWGLLNAFLLLITTLIVVSAGIVRISGIRKH